MNNIKAVFLLFSILICSCIFDTNSEKFNGNFKIIAPKEYLSDSILDFRYYNALNDLQSIEYYENNVNKLKYSKILIYSDGRFHIENKFLNDSVGNWEPFDDHELGMRLSLTFDHINAGANLILDDKGYRILELPAILLKDSIDFSPYRPAVLKFVYKKE